MSRISMGGWGLFGMFSCVKTEWNYVLKCALFSGVMISAIVVFKCSFVSGVLCVCIRPSLCVWQMFFFEGFKGGPILWCVV